MAPNQRLHPAELVAHACQEREHPWTWVLDGGLVLGVLAWLTFGTTMSAHPVLFAVFSAVLVGTIVHRAFVLMEAPRPSGPRGR